LTENEKKLLKNQYQIAHCFCFYKPFTNILISRENYLVSTYIYNNIIFFVKSISRNTFRERKRMKGKQTSSFLFHFYVRRSKKTKKKPNNEDFSRNTKKEH